LKYLDEQISCVFTQFICYQINNNNFIKCQMKVLLIHMPLLSLINMLKWQKVENLYAGELLEATFNLTIILKSLILILIQDYIVSQMTRENIHSTSKDAMSVIHGIVV
jgi:hypothetical protein